VFRPVCIAFLFAGSAWADGLPDGVTEILNREYPGWKIAPVHSEIDRWFREYGFDSQPSVVKGDFDNDGRPDYAVQFLHGGQSRVAAFLNRDGKWEQHRLTADGVDPLTFLIKYPRGEKDFDFEKMKPFRYSNDAIGVMYFSRTPWTFMYRRGKFLKKSAPSDEEFDGR
jgi:hypothetical protein